MRDKLIAAGVKNLREFGYPDCTKNNILTVMIFRSFFRKMVEETMETTKTGAIYDACVALIAEIDAIQTND